MESVRLMVMDGLSTKQASEKLGISVKVLGTWRRKYLNELKMVSSKEGGLGADLFNTELAVLHLMFDSSRARQWWKAVGHEYFSRDFVLFVNNELRETEPTDTLWNASVTWAE